MNSHLTAINRKALPVPIRWLLAQRMIHGHVLDYGCGKCEPINNVVFPKYPQIKSITNFDPYYAPIQPVQPNYLGEGWYDTILCTYVLCTLPKTDEKRILQGIQKLLRPNGVAYITVRNDEPKGGYGQSSRGTFQRKVEIPYLFELRKCHQYRIYLLTRINSKIRIMKIRFFRKVRRQSFEGTQYDFATMFNLDRGGVNLVLKGRRNSLYGWKIICE